MHASWEPCHSRNCERVPWQQYVKLGDILRHFGYTIVALHGCLRTEIQVIVTLTFYSITSSQSRTFCLLALSNGLVYKKVRLQGRFGLFSKIPAFSWPERYRKH